MRLWDGADMLWIYHKKLNSVRNDLTHKISYKVNDKVVKELRRPLGFYYSNLYENLGDNYESKWAYPTLFGRYFSYCNCHHFKKRLACTTNGCTSSFPANFCLPNFYSTLFLNDVGLHTA